MVLPAESRGETAAILVGSDGYVERWSELHPTVTCTAYALTKQWWKGLKIFHRDGRRYGVQSAEDPRPQTWWRRLLTCTVWNPKVEAKMEYRQGRFYDLADLKAALAQAIKRDDDILTQFYEAPDLIARLEAAGTFAAVARVIELAEHEPQ